MACVEYRPTRLVGERTSPDTAFPYRLSLPLIAWSRQLVIWVEAYEPFLASDEAVGRYMTYRPVQRTPQADGGIILFPRQFIAFDDLTTATAFKLKFG